MDIETRLKAKFERNKLQNLSKLYFNIYSILKEAIVEGEIPPATSLPPTRSLALTLKVSRSTILKAYDLLRLDGFIESKIGSSYLTKDNLTVSSPNNNIRDENAYPEPSALGQSFLKNLDLINSTDDKSIAFRPGLPPLDIFPVREWKNLSNLYWRNISLSALSYSPSSGIELLKKSIAQYLLLSRNLKCNPEQIIIVSGSLQSLYLLGSAILNPGDKAIIENPSFPNVYSTFKGIGAQIEGVEVDSKGIKTQSLQKKQFDNSKLIHCTPSSHYPSGAIMSLGRKKKLLAWARANKSWIIENDYEHELSNWEQESPTIFSLDQDQRCIYLGTLNRLLHPSIRIGYMVLPPLIYETVEAIQKHSHRFVSPSIQIVLNQFIEQKFLQKHVKKLVRVVRERKEAFISNFNRELSEYFNLLESDTLSLQLIAKCKTTLSDKRISERFLKNNIVVHRYSKCFLGKKKEQGIILGFASVPIPKSKSQIKKMKLLMGQF